MKTNLDPVLEAPPVSQELPASNLDIWEPPFERWMRIADSLLGHVPGAYCDLYSRPQTFARIPKTDHRIQSSS